MTLSRTRLAVAATAVAVLAAGTPVAYAALDGEPAVVAARGRAYVQTRLFFGTERPDGGPAVTPREFSAFIDRHVTPAFPDGLTVQDGQGQWRDATGGIERERSYELILLYPAGESGSRDGSVEEIRTAYRKLYGQESVARVDERVRVDF
ncbi:DUF3574 domain-containing protein [Streptomyces formicae]|uniref:DUF3574 domain-containing protein n=1 Tax=Streptomyces formicae TaxID=1616117 RepID=A0ABY3WV89_9ACTN|nr:DUF3574 domain-containing protein [Streptomyces formicae]